MYNALRIPAFLVHMHSHQLCPPCTAIADDNPYVVLVRQMDKALEACIDETPQAQLAMLCQANCM